MRSLDKEEACLKRFGDLSFAIIGAGGMARILVKILRWRAARLSIISRSLEKAKRFSKRMKVSYSTIDELGEYDAVILTAPPQHLPEVAQRISPRLREGCLVMDVSSVKLGVVEKVLERLPERVEYLSVHPLFGPATRKLAGNRIVLIPIRGESYLDGLKALFEDAGLKVVFSTPEEHDRIMAFIQVAHHLSYLSLALTLWERDSEIVRDYATRSLRRTLRMFRSLSGNLRVIREIAGSNSYGGEAAEALKASIDRLMKLDEDAWSRVEEALKTLPEKALP